MTRALVSLLLLTSLIACGGGEADPPPVVIIDDNDASPDDSSPNTTTPDNNVTPSNNQPSNATTTPNNDPNNQNPNNQDPNNTTTLTQSEFSLLQVGLSGPIVAHDASGTAHMVYAAQVDPSIIVYGTCLSRCGEEQSWSFAEIFNGYLLSEPRMIVTESGAVHLLFDALGEVGSASETIYASCVGSCTDPGRWMQLNLAPTIGGASGAYRGAPFVMSQSGELSFITTGGSLPGSGLVLAQCSGSCEQASSWRAGVVRSNGLRAALATTPGALHLLVDDERGTLVYSRCERDCAQGERWSAPAPLFAHNFDGEVAFGASGEELRVVYNQGVAAENESAAVKAQDRRMLFWSCSSGCEQASSWRGTLLPNAPDDGYDNALVAIGAATVIAYPTNGLELRVDVCEANCLEPASWSAVIADDSERMRADIDPYTILCGGSSRPLFAGWYPGAPSVSIHPVTGSALIAHRGYIIRQCAGISNLIKQYMLARVIAID